MPCTDCQCEVPVVLKNIHWVVASIHRRTQTITNCVSVDVGVVNRARCHVNWRIRAQLVISNLRGKLKQPANVALEPTVYDCECRKRYVKQCATE